MAYSIISQGDHKTAYLKEFVVDTIEDIKDLPTFPNTAIGSNCLVIGTSDVFMLGNDNEWYKL